MKFEKDLSKITVPYVDPSEHVDPDTAERFIISYLLLQIITLS